MSTRDTKYYFEDGSCVFNVGKYLFKLHRSLLIRDSLFFEKMFTLPQPHPQSGYKESGEGRGDMEGSSDNNPIYCQDSVEAFRALCWGLYARPAEIRAQDDPNRVNLNRLVVLADIAHKYEFGFLESWANGVIQGHLASMTASQHGTWTLDILEKVLVLTTKMDVVDPTFKKQVETQWLSLAVAGSDTPSDLRRALDFADSLGSPRHQGLAYYHALRRVGVLTSVNPGVSDFSEIVAGPSSASRDLMRSLSSQQRLRLMNGLWCLDSLRCHSLMNMPFEDQCPECYSLMIHQASCQVLWKRFWSDFNGYHDFGKILEVALERASARNDSAPCWRLVKPRVKDMLTSFEERLPTYFTLH